MRTLPLAKTALLFALCTLCASASVLAQTLVQYNFGPPPTFTPTLDDTSVAANASSTAITGNTVTVSTIPPVNTTLGINNNGAAQATYPILNTIGYTSSFSASHYFGFVLTPNSGYRFDLTDLYFDVASGGAASTRQFRVEYSFDGFATAGTLAGSGTAAPVLTTFHEFNRVTFSLTDQDALNSITTSPVAFRFFGSTGDAGESIRYDNITVRGNIAAIPEPSTCVLLSLGLCALIGWRRRR